MFRRVSQPPVNPALRDPERHGFWPGTIVSIIGIGFLAFGGEHLTGIEAGGGGTASEAQLVKAYSSGGLQYPEQTASPPPRSDDPAVLERWSRQKDEAQAVAWQVRVDTAAKTPCPT
jgi:hypothetical protein